MFLFSKFLDAAKAMVDRFIDRLKDFALENLDDKLFSAEFKRSRMLHWREKIEKDRVGGYRLKSEEDHPKLWKLSQEVCRFFDEEIDIYVVPPEFRVGAGKIFKKERMMFLSQENLGGSPRIAGDEGTKAIIAHEVRHLRNNSIVQWPARTLFTMIGKTGVKIAQNNPTVAASAVASAIVVNKYPQVLEYTARFLQQHQDGINMGIGGVTACIAVAYIHMQCCEYLSDIAGLRVTNLDGALQPLKSLKESRTPEFSHPSLSNRKRVLGLADKYMKTYSAETKTRI